MVFAESYVPVLLNFRDNGIIYESGDIEQLRAQILVPANGIVPCRGGGVFRHQFDDEWVLRSVQDMGLTWAAESILEGIEVYYYHHRIVLRYSFREFAAELERNVRELVLRHSESVIASHFVRRINSASVNQGPLPDESGRVTAYYSYCVMFLPERERFVENIENLLGSHTFRIVEVTPSLRENDRVHIVRISIPSTNVYSKTAPDEFLVVDVINSIYQHMLYSKKEQDQKVLFGLEEFSVQALAELNVMQESQLHALWDHAVDALGGRMVDLQGVGQQTNMFRLSVFALGVASLSVLLSVVSVLIAVLSVT